MRRFLGLLLIAASVLSVGTVAAGGAQREQEFLTGHRVAAVSAQRQVLLPPPAQRPVLPVLPRPEFAIPLPHRPRRVAPGAIGRVLSRSSTSPIVGFSQEGISKLESFGGYEPADVSIAVGPDYIGETVNAAVGWWRIGAGFNASTIRSLGSFFTTTTTDRRSDQMGDPRLLYDASSGRWFFVAFDVTRTETDFAVSMSSDPTQSWWIYAVPAAGCPDQPRIAVSDTMLAVSYNLFSSCATREPPYVGGVVLLYDKAALLTGAAPAGASYGPDPRFSSITPAASYDGGSTIYLVSTDYVLSQVVLYTATAIGQTIPIQRAQLNLLQKPPPPYQLGSSVPLDPGDTRVQDAFIVGGNIWLAANDGCTPQGASGVQACIRYVELSEGGQVLDQREEALANGRFAIYPAFRPDGNGNLFSIYGFTSPSDYPGRAVTVDPGHATGYFDMKDGEGADASGRWGDYFSAARDPSDPTRVWVAGAYGTDGGWRTFIAALSTSSFSIPNPTPPPPPPPHTGGAADTTPPRVIALPSSGHVGGAVHLRYRLWENSGRTRERIRVRHLGKLVASISTSLASIGNRGNYYVLWRAPAGVFAHLSFCVVATDPANNASAPSCASLQLTGGRS